MSVHIANYGLDQLLSYIKDLDEYIAFAVVPENSRYIDVEDNQDTDIQRIRQRRAEMHDIIVKAHHKPR